MCRLLAAISTEDLFAPWFLHAAPQSLLTQSHIDRKRRQGDGWGVGWFEAGGPRIRKSPGAVYREKRLVMEVARRARGQTLVAHVRWASNPMKLPKREIIGPEHTQPFLHGRWIFAHNGTLFIPREVRAALGPWERFIQGNNDSEVLFYWLLKHLDFLLAPSKRPASAKRIAQAVGRSIRGIDKIWAGCRKKYPIHPYPYHGLNWVLTDGERLIAFCYVDPAGFGKTKALCASGQPYYQLQWMQKPALVAVASEALDPAQPWKPLAHGDLLVSSRKSNQLAVEIVPVVNS